MAIKPKCDFCRKELDHFGALLFSPPDKNSNARKFHICKFCFARLVKNKK